MNRGGARLFVALLVLTLGVAGALRSLDDALRTADAPNGIVSFELAGSAERAGRILASWNEDARVRAAFGLGLDFLFLVLYSTTIAWACLWAAKQLRGAGPLAALGVPLAWGQWCAALLDAVENVALWALLVGPVTAPWPRLAQVCAIPKFALVFAGLLYAAIGAGAVLVGRLRR
jgi:hypothetical protein